MAEQFRLSASFRDMRFPNPLTPFTLFFFPFLSVFFLGIMPFSTPLSFIFLFLFCPSFSAGFPNPLIPFACGKRTESLSGRTLLLCLFVYCFSFACRMADTAVFVCGMTVLSVVLPAGEKLTDKASFFPFSRKIRYRVQGKYEGIRRDKKWCEAECRRII